MFKEMKSRRLALLVAIALGGGGFLSSAQNVSAADVTGRNVTIDDTQAPSNNAEHPGGGAAFGTAAGFIKVEHDNGNVKDNTLTFKNLHYTKQLYGGLTFGTGNVTGNKVFVNQATSPHQSISDGIFGGAANGGGNVEGNHATFNGNQLNGDLVGGMATDGGTGTVKKNTATLKGGNVNGSIYGGTTGNQANGDVLENEVLIEGGIVTGTGNVYGGYTDENSNVKGNTVTIKGGVLNGIYGGYSSGTGEVSGNTVNLGDGTSAMAAGYAINGTIYGGENTADQSKVSNNTLNVNTNATAHNIKNFSTINFNFNAYTNTTQSLLTLNDSHGTTIERLSDLKLKDVPRGSGTLIENASGLTINSYSGALKLTAEKTETIIDKQGTTKIGYNAYQFRDSTETRSEGLEVWGGRSTIGNTTTKNTVTLNGNYTGRNAYGGRTDGTGSTATGEDATNHSIENTITLDGAGSIVNNMTGGMTLSAGGKATGNRAVLKAGTVNGSLTGGSVGSSGGDVTGNFVNINGGTVHGTTYGGYASGTGKAEHNTVTLTGGTLNSDIYGGVASSGAAVKNIVNITGGSAANHDVYGGFSTHGDATGNTVTITGGSVRNVDGGRSLNGHATNNIVNIGSADAGFSGSITGKINGGSGTGFGKDYVTGNKLNLYGNVSATNINHFAEINFHFNSHVNPSTSFLSLNDSGGTFIKSLSGIQLHGDYARKGTLLKNTGGTITISDGGDRLVKTDGNKELVLAKSSDNKRIDYEGYQFKGATNTTTDDGGTYKDIFGGRSILGNTTTQNEITVSDAVTYRNAYGGWTSGTGSDAPADKQKNSTLNKIKVSGAANVTGKVYGGFTGVAGGNATGNEVTIEKSITGAVVGGKALGEASGNTVTVKANTGAVTGGEGATTNNNTVNLHGATVSGAVTGGTQASGTGNTLNVKGMNTAQNIVGFQKVKFDASNVAAGATMLNLSTGTTTLDKSAIDATGSTVNGGITLLENANGITINGLGATDSVVKSETDATTEKNIGVERNGGVIKKVTYEGYQFAGVTTAVPSGTNIYGGISKAGNSTHDNKFTVNDGSGKTVYGGYTTGANGTATDKNDSHTNEVTLTGGTYTNVYGGWTNVGKAVSNTVNVTGNATGSIVGGYSASGEASNNVVSVMNAAFTGDITGGRGAVTNYNVIRLRNAAVTGTVTGGTAANRKDNTLAVSYGSGTSSSVGDITNIQNLRFDMENAPVRNANPLLKLTNVSSGDKNLTGMKFAVHRSGATQKLAKGDTFTLMENTTLGGRNITVGSNVTAEGRDGVSRRYTFDITQDPHDAHKLIATVTKAGMDEQSKSIVETRAGASAFINDGADFLAGTGMDAAKKEARAAAAAAGGSYGLWAGMGGGSLRHETGSYVDMKGWNLGVGWARENAVQAGTLTFGPFIEYGRGSYDSYLDDGTHGSGKTSYVGAGMMARLETAADNWIDGALRVGRTKSDYTGLANYDTTNTYYGMQVGVGKDFHVRAADTVSAYVRYAYSHTAGASAHLSSGETYDFDAVNSHRLRIGTRYTHGATALSQFYAGLAWEYEFDGDARATSQGDSALSPSLKGSSALLELGYRFAPQGSRMSYDLNLNGWQGKRRGVTGGVSVKWAF